MQENTTQQILQFWYITEFLNQNNYPHVAKKETKNRKNITLEHLIHEDTDIYKRMDQDYYSMKHLPVKSDTIDICLGKITRDLCVKMIYKLSKQKDNRINPTQGHIAIMGLQVSNLKRYIPNSFNLSPIIWTIYKLSTSSNKNLNVLINEDEYKKDLDEIEAWLMNQEELDMNLIQLCFEKVKNKFLASLELKELSYQGVFSYQRFSDEQTKEKSEELSNFANLNMNFFSQDLNMMKEMNRTNMLSNCEFGKRFIKPYISCGILSDNQDSSHRINVLQDSSKTRSFLKQVMHIEHAPLGKWPSRYAPVFMQQLAINLAVSNNQKFPTCVSVNGPPGTGKTTMLKEIIAESIVKKAEIISLYEHANDAFTECDFEAGDCVNHGYSKYYSHYYKVADELNEYSILVASCNNAAVENITKELPDGEALSKSLMNINDQEENEIKLRQIRHLFDEQDSDIYFTKYANEFFNSKDSNQYYWGLISVPLGKKSNQGAFTYILSKLFKDEFSRNEMIEKHKVKYGKARELFQKQLDVVNELKHKISSVCDIEKVFVSSIQSLEEQIKQCDKEKAVLHNDVGKYKDSVIESNKVKQQLQKDMENANQHHESNEQICSLKQQILLDVKDKEQSIRKQIKELEASRSFKEYLFSLFGTKSLKKEEIEELYLKLNAMNLEVEEAEHQFQLSLQTYEQSKAHIEQIGESIVSERNKLIDYSNKKKEAEKQIKVIENQLKDLEKQKDEIFKKYETWSYSSWKRNDQAESYDLLNDTFLDAFFNKNEEKNLSAHLSNPWIFESYNREREKLFYYALQLNKEFLLSSSYARSNIKNLLMMWTGSDGKDTVKFKECDKVNAFPSLFQTVSLLVPVISTTFASVGRFLHDIKEPYQLGTLIIDEAGQAQPQMALGAMVRCRKAVIVGDPKQVEPVVTDDLDAIKQLLKNDYTASYINKHLSVQQFADELNPYGTYFEESNGDAMWVGCPLVVHRRCINPMFDISNAISYSGIMKQQTAEPSEEKSKSFSLTFSQWIQKGGKEKNHLNKNHFVEEQGEVALQIIETAFEKANGEMPSIYIISPFTSIVDEMKEMIKKSSMYQMNQELMKDWLDKSVGTVHTFQGKEANEVIFLLGCDQDAMSAVRWVNSNIINVAVTRAKYRLCVIGDYHVWKHNKYAKIMKEIIDAYTVKKLDALKAEVPTEDNKKMARLLMARLPKSTDYLEEDDEELKINTYGFMKQMHGYKFGDLTQEELKAYHLDQSEWNHLDFKVKSHLLMGIKISSIYEFFSSVFHVDYKDHSFKKILICKATELYVRESFIEGLKLHFGNESVGSKKIKNAEARDFTLGASASCIFDHYIEIHKLLTDSNYDLLWWKRFSSNLKRIGKIRNDCCHVDEFDEKQEQELLTLLFEERTFINIKAGKGLENVNMTVKD